jgi:hypothetical protein
LNLIYFSPDLVVNIVTAVVNIYNREHDWSIVNVLILPQLGLIAGLNVIGRSSAVRRPMKRRSLFKLPGYHHHHHHHHHQVSIMSLNFGTLLVRSRA